MSIIDKLRQELGNNPDEDGFVFYRNYLNVEEAKAFATILEENSVPYFISASESTIDSAIVGSGLFPKAIIKLRPEDFVEVDGLIRKEFENSEDISFFENHHLNQLDNEELMDILITPDKWSKEDANIAHKLLRMRNIPLSSEEIANLRDERNAKLSEGKILPLSVATITVLSIAIGVFYGLVFIIGGISMALYIFRSKSVDLDGNSFFTYDEASRKKGKYIIYIGLAGLIISIIILRNMV